MGIYVRPTKILPAVLPCLTLALVQVGCTSSPNGSVKEIVTTGAPTFDHKPKQIFNSPTTTYTVQGECDPISYALETSLDESTWTTLPGGCPPNGTFSLTVTFLKEYKFWVRAKTKTGYTGLAFADVRLVLPPTSPSLAFVSTGNSDDDLKHGTQFGADGISKETLNNGTYTVKSSLIDTIYEH